MRRNAVVSKAKTILEWSLAVKKGERVLILVDTETDEVVTKALYDAARALNTEPTIVTIQAPEVAGQNPSAIAVRAIETADVVICPVLPAIGHSSSVKRQLDSKRIRYLSMPGITGEQMVRGGGCANYEEVLKTSQKLVQILNRANRIYVRSELGTDLTASITGMQYWASAALARNPGELSCFPDGEACGAPVEGTTEGKVIIDTSLTMFGLITEPITYYVEKGSVIEVDGGSQARDVQQLINQIENASNIAEIAIGTNPNARVTGNVSEDKKGIGKVHVALGNNLLYGGTTKSPLHLDGVISKPTVIVDDRILIDSGLIKI
jgi:leucyl aminopeptidase (aminopeptidase T)